MAELADDDEQLQERLSGLAEQMTTEIEEMREGIFRQATKRDPRCGGYCEADAVLDGVRKAEGQGRQTVALPETDQPLSMILKQPFATTAKARLQTV